MSNKGVVCEGFITDGINREMCNAYEKISLPIYPSLYEIKTFCKTSNHLKCPIRNFSTVINLFRTEIAEVEDNSRFQYQK